MRSAYCQRRTEAPAEAPITTKEEGPLQLERSSESTASTQEDDSATTREKPVVTMREYAPQISHLERSHSVTNIEELPTTRKEALADCNERGLLSDTATKVSLTITRKEPAYHN